MIHTDHTDPHAVRAALRRVRKALCGRFRAAQGERDEAFTHAFPALVAAVEAGFRQEEALLETLGAAGLREQRADNAVLLCALHRVMCRVEQGDVALGRQVAGALGDLLSLHRLGNGAIPAARRRRLAARPAGPLARR